MQSIQVENLINKTLYEKLQENDSAELVQKDLNAGIKLLTQIALESIPPKNEEARLCKRARRPVSDDLNYKVKDFVQRKFLEICLSGFPFSQMNNPACKAALKYCYDSCRKTSFSDFLTHFLTQDESRWLSEGELDVKYGPVISHLNYSSVFSTCFHLFSDYSQSNKSAYYFLWLFKACGCKIKIPLKEEFKKYDVMIRTFLDIFKRTSIGDWESKIDFLEVFLRDLKDEYKAEAVNELSKSLCDETVTIGLLLKSALEVDTLNKSLAYFNSLSPYFSSEFFEIFFERPYIPLAEEPRLDSDFTRDLSYLGCRRDVIEVHENLFLRVYHKDIINKKPMPPYLLAYNKNSEKLIWGIPLDGDQHVRVKSVGDAIAIYQHCDRKVRIINPKNGENVFTVEFPYGIEFELREWYESDKIHISSSGNVYQEARSQLFGYKVNGTKLEMSFKKDMTSKDLGRPIGLSTHFGFHETIDRILTLYNPSGFCSKIKDCLSVKAVGNKLYTIEKDIKDDSSCQFRIRTLLNSEKVFSDVEKSISIEGERAFIKDVCHNGRCILYSRNEKTIFLDIDKETLVYSSFELSDINLIDKYSCGVWTWNGSSKELHKITPEGNIKKGKIHCRALIDVNKKGVIYYKN